MIVQLAPHPDFPPSAVTSIEVTLLRSANGRVAMTYEARGRIDDVLVPEDANHERTDELWRHTCFEMFARLPGNAGYREFNFAPSSRWAAYGFAGYRTGMLSPPLARHPLIAAARTQGVLSLSVVAYPDLPADALWHVAITAIIEERSGAKSYWALRHAPGKPDFHHADGFALELPAGSHA